MNAPRFALLSGLALLLTLPAGAEDATPPALAAKPRAPASQESFLYLPPAPPKNGTAEGPIVSLPAFQVNSAFFPTYGELNGALQVRLLEPCSLIKEDVSAKRRYDFFLAPVALSNGAAGFGIVRMSW
jgi:hypothetical protein